MIKNTYKRRPKAEVLKEKRLKKIFESSLKGWGISKVLKTIKMSEATYYKDNDYGREYERGKLQRLEQRSFDLVEILDKETLGYFTTETTTNKDENGLIISTKEVKKWNRSVPVLLMFNLVNSDPKNWQSINKEKLIIDKNAQEVTINYKSKDDV